ncbi:MAG TPA: glycoside hydrolase domain-containing protein, partial [Arachidicoccus sp.]|nr:glycoside hydrolase domain-containing protein [Arachidicoccus sp.]
LKAHRHLELDDMSLTLPVRKALATYFMGMGSGKPFGRNGSTTPEYYDWKWKGPQNSYWIGNYDAGIYCKFLGATYNGPMLNLYRPDPPPSWYNENKGGFKIRKQGTNVNASTFTGKRLLEKDSMLTFEFSLLITPVKKLNPKAQFSNRYYQNYGNPYPLQEDIKAGVNVINVHHANRINPYINYPFVMVDSMRAFVNHYHQAGVKTKIYYTIRELSNQCAEIWALRSLGTEIFSDGKGGGYPWLQEHLVNHYDVQWFTPIDGYEACDAAIRTSGDSRWYNYYIEGLRWLTKNVGIDGLYLDDVAYDRDMLKRMRKVMDMVKPGCMIDLHSNTDFSKGPATQYTEFFPYIDKLWFGENFHYEKMQPANWMVETSGIPFGLMGDMLFSGGNPWRGLIYGMTSRDGWPTDGKLCNPKPIWQVLDRFGIKDSKMFGYWLPNTAISSSDPKVLATAYKNGEKVLIAVASWDDQPVNVHLKINWKELGIAARKVKFVALEIKGFQEAATFEMDAPMLVKPGKGWLLEIE